MLIDMATAPSTDLICRPQPVVDVVERGSLPQLDVHWCACVFVFGRACIHVAGGVISGHTMINKVITHSSNTWTRTWGMIMYGWGGGGGVIDGHCCKK